MIDRRARTDAVGRFETTKGDVCLRWAAADGCSVRAYANVLARPVAGCVSTRGHELVVVLDGEHELQFGPAQQNLRLSPGEACLIHCGTPHLNASSAGTRLLILDVRAPAIDGLGVTRYRALGGVTAALGQLLWDRATLLPGAELGALAAAFVAGQRPAGIQLLESGHNTAGMVRVKNIIEANFSEPLNLAALAAAQRLDRFYLTRGFKHNFGMTPMQYLQFLRLEAFLWTRVAGAATANLTAAAAEAGFGDYSTFCRRIHRVVGNAPSRLARYAL